MDPDDTVGNTDDDAVLELAVGTSPPLDVCPDGTGPGLDIVPAVV